MIKAKFLFFFFIFLLTAYSLKLTAAQAAPCYGGQMPHKDKWNIGAQAHVIKDRDLRKDFGSVSSAQYFYQMSFGVFHWLSLDGKIGLGEVTYRPENGEKATFNSNFAGGYGFRIRPYRNEQEKIGVILGFQHISVHPSSKEINGVENYVILDDWQGSFLVSKGIGKLTPYAGARLTRLDLIHRIKGQGRERKESDVDLGAVVGFDFNFLDCNFLNFEARFPEESSYSLGITHNF